MGTLGAPAWTVGLLLTFGPLPLEVMTIVGALAVAGGLWLFAVALFTALAEAEGAIQSGGNAIGVVRDQLSLLISDTQLQRFVLTPRPARLDRALAAVSSRHGRARGIRRVGRTWSIRGGVESRGNPQHLCLGQAIGSFQPQGAHVVGSGGRSGTGRCGGSWSGRDRLWHGMADAGPALRWGVRLGRSTHIVDMDDETRGPPIPRFPTP